MLKIHQDYLIDENGNKKAVVVPLSEWQKIKEELEELDDIRAYDQAKSKPSEPIPFDEAVQQIRKGKSS
jgi:PHD/YefM family antitoxin component YafN of YafNO toxin-antitoxin module